MFAINAEHQFDRPLELSALESERRSPAVMNIHVREWIKLIGRTKRRKRSRDGEMMRMNVRNDVRGSKRSTIGGDKIQSS
jgi:hypothetical protein